MLYINVFGNDSFLYLQTRIQDHWKFNHFQIHWNTYWLGNIFFCLLNLSFFNCLIGEVILDTIYFLFFIFSFLPHSGAADHPRSSDHHPRWSAGATQWHYIQHGTSRPTGRPTTGIVYISIHINKKLEFWILEYLFHGTMLNTPSYVLDWQEILHILELTSKANA